jgi:hypothetical protein
VADLLGAVGVDAGDEAVGIALAGPKGVDRGGALPAVGLQLRQQFFEGGAGVA